MMGEGSSDDTSYQHHSVVTPARNWGITHRAKRGFRSLDLQACTISDNGLAAMAGRLQTALGPQNGDDHFSEAAARPSAAPLPFPRRVASRSRKMKPSQCRGLVELN